MNCTPFAITYTDMLRSAGLTDTRLGRGLLPTWTARWLKWSGLGIPIDHVLIRGPLHVEQWERGPVTSSDHRFVKVTLR